MPLKRVYISPNVDDGVYEAKKLFQDSIVVRSPSDEQYRKKCLPSLVATKRTIIFTNTEEVSEDLLKASLDFSTDMVWIFKQLRSNSKLCKYLTKNFPVEKCAKLSTYKEKKEFVQKAFREKNLPGELLFHVLQRSGESRNRINSELDKLSYGLQVLNHPLDCLVSDVAYYDIFNLLDAILQKDNTEALRLISKIELELDIYQFAHLLTTYIQFYIYLAVGDEESAKKTWNMPAYLIGDKKALARKRGLKNLVDLSLLVRDLLLDYYSKKPASNRIRQFIFESCFS